MGIIRPGTEGLGFTECVELVFELSNAAFGVLGDLPHTRGFTTGLQPGSCPSPWAFRAIFTVRSSLATATPWLACLMLRGCRGGKSDTSWPKENEMIDSKLTHFELRFQSLFNSGRGYSFPCDSKGFVDLAQLSDGARNNYLYARAMVGRELAAPAVRPCVLH
jgi:hypothetical protein